MLIECGNCGAPLDVKEEARITTCKYCRKSNRVDGTRTIAAKTPDDWKPPPKWTPPANVPASQRGELPYQANPKASGRGCLIVLICLTALIGAIVYAAQRRVFALDPAKLDTVTMTEPPADLADKLGGKWDESAKWVTVSMKPPFQTAVFTYWGKDTSRPSGLTLNYDGSSCSDDSNAIRERIRTRLGRRFDGVSWRWGPAHLHIDEKCSNIVLGTSVGEENDDLAKQQADALFRLFRKEVFGRNVDVTQEELRGILGGGYDGQTLTAALAQKRIEDVRGKLGLSGAVFRDATQLASSAEIPFASPIFSHVTAEWKNEMGGLLRSLYFYTFADKEIPDLVSFATCIAQKLNGRLELRQTDYASGKTTAMIFMQGPRIYVNGTMTYVIFDDVKGSPDAPLSAFIAAVDSCDGD